MRILFYVMFSLAISGYSLYLDWGSESFTWFQRSGALVALAGAILSYRSIFRLGISGVGGAPDNGATIVTVAGYSEDGKMLIKHSQEYLDSQRQILWDKL
ncbi:TPA: hypothetical protein ACPJ0A_004420 [Vibrio diabolicus]|uniref:hypothetical protein n=1 Tax=Vibrio diabolicus TaxID=50719 RepID=UPI0022A96695|nr:hypothetical protein [Vibrio diabolicus]MCZ2366321.1 hypothetical protein [Vibrio diabolicus]